VDLDGKRITDFDPKGPNVPARKNWPEPKRERPRPEVGYIGLQNHDPGDIVWFKEVSIRALPTTPVNTPPARKSLKFRSAANAQPRRKTTG
jgi:hypothetical protein